MTRADFIERGEVKVDFLKYYRLVCRWAVKNNNLNVADLELLFYLDPIQYFTLKDFKDGTFYYTWDRDRFYRLQREDWIKKIENGVGSKGNHNKYVVSSKGKRLIQRIYRILIDKEDLPYSPKANSIMKGESYSDKVYRQAIQKFNKKK